MDPSELLPSKDWVQLGAELKRPALRKSADRGRRSVAEISHAESGERQIVVRDGYYRPIDGTADFFALWSASPHGWVQAAAFVWNAETRAWEPSERQSPRPT